MLNRFSLRKFHTVRNWYQFLAAHEKLVPIRHIIRTTISRLVKIHTKSNFIWHTCVFLTLITPPPPPICCSLLSIPILHSFVTDICDDQVPVLHICDNLVPFFTCLRIWYQFFICVSCDTYFSHVMVRYQFFTDVRIWYRIFTRVRIWNRFFTFVKIWYNIK